MIAVCVICEPGELEVKCLLFCYSFRKFCDDNSIKVFVLVPENQINELKSLDQLRSLGFEVRPFKNTLVPIYKKRLIPGDKVSNKLFFLSVEGNFERVVFFDTDIVSLKKFDSKIFCNQSALTAKQADRANVTRWKEIYSLFSIKYPELKYPCTVDGISIPAYFNAGYLNVKADVKDVLQKEWCYYYNELSKPEILSMGLYKPFNRDQVSLSLAVQKLNLSYEMASESLNYPVRHKKVDNVVYFAHYHDPLTLYRNRELLEIYNQMIKELSVPKELFKQCREWNLVLSSSLYRQIYQRKWLRKIILRLTRTLKVK